MADTRLTVLHLISARKVFGAERVAVQICKGLSQDCRMVLGVMDRDAEDNEVLSFARSQGVEALWIPVRGQMDLQAISRLRKAMRDLRVHIVHSHNYKSNFYAMLSRPSSVRWVATAHGWVSVDLKPQIYQTIDKVLIRNADAIVGVSLNLLEEFSRWRIPRAKVHYIPNAVECKGDLLPEEDDTFTVGFIGRMEREKNFAYVVNVLSSWIRGHKGDSVRAVMVGDGSLRGWAEDRVAREGLEDKIEFLGKVRFEEMEAVYRSLDCLFLPSLREGLPMVVLEAMCWGVPIVGSTVALRDVEESPGRVIIKDLRSVSEGVRSLEGLYAVYGRSRGEWRAMRLALQERAGDFSFQRMLSRYDKIYRRLLEEDGKVLAQ